MLQSNLNNRFLDKSILSLVESYNRKEISPTDVAEECIDRVERLDNQYKAFESFDPEQLRAQASISEKRLNAGMPLRSLEGIPVGVKDIFNTADFPTQMGSPIWKGFTPGNDARVIYNLKQSGGVVAGKTVTAEFAVHALRKTVNPHSPERTPGTSSSGSAVSVATGMVPVALGTQTAGSIVRPASFCGVYGCKPSFGIIPRTGTLKTTDSLDTIGFFTIHFSDLRNILNTLRVHGPNYPISHTLLNDHVRQTKPDGRPWRIAFTKTHTWDIAPDYARKAMTNWVETISKDNSIEIVDSKLPDEMVDSHAVHSDIYDCTLAYYFQEEFKKKELVSQIMNEIIERGLTITPKRYQDSLRSQEKMGCLMDVFFKNIDALICLSTAGEAPLREETELPDPALMWTLTHLPVISAPVFQSPSGLPFGAQLVARRYNDYLLLDFAEYLRSRNHIPVGPNPVIYK